MKAGRKRELVRSFLKRILSITMSKIRISRAQKQIYLHFAEANKAKIQDKPKAKTNSFALCRGERSADMDSKQSRIPVCGGKNRHDNESARQLLPKERTQDYLCPRSAKRLRQALFSYLCPVIFVLGRTAPGKTRLRFTSSPHASRHEANRTNGRYSRLPQSSENIC